MKRIDDTKKIDIRTTKVITTKKIKPEKQKKPDFTPPPRNPSKK